MSKIRLLKTIFLLEIYLFEIKHLISWFIFSLLIYKCNRSNLYEINALDVRYCALNSYCDFELQVYINSI